MYEYWPWVRVKKPSHWSIEGRDMLIIFFLSSDVANWLVYCASWHAPRPFFRQKLYLGVTLGPRTTNLRRMMAAAATTVMWSMA